VPEAIAEARRATRGVAERYGADEAVVAAVALCVSEAFSNAILHAYRGRHGEIEIEAYKPDGYLCIYVRDHGVGMRPRSDSPGAGLGLPLITKLASGFTIRSARGDSAGTELAMRFDLGA
jgi:anti-sigma regulatory factor (Ser/Thr protein kinase)